MMNLVGQWNRVQIACKFYHDGEYDFGIDTSVISTLSNCAPDDARDFVRCLSVNNASMYAISFRYQTLFHYDILESML